QTAEPRALIRIGPGEGIERSDSEDQEDEAGKSWDQPDIAATDEEGDGNDRGPDAAGQEDQPLGGEAVGVDADPYRDEEQRQRDDGQPEPEAAEQRRKRPGTHEWRIEREPGPGADDHEAQHHPADRALRQLAREDNLRGVGEEDQRVERQEGRED